MTLDDPLLALAIVLVVGVLSGIAVSRFGIPGVTGQILAGILLGESVFGILPSQINDLLKPITHFALSLIAVKVGSHLDIRRLRNAGKRLSWLLLLEATVTPLLIFAVVMALPNASWIIAILLAAMGISTAPATVISIVKETRSRGVFVKTLIAAVAFNNLACVALFGIAYSAAHVELDPSKTSSWMIVAVPLLDVLTSCVLGTIVGLLLVLASTRIVKPDRLASLSLVAILLTTGLADHWESSALLSCMFLGVALANFKPEDEDLGSGVMGNLDGAILAVFFTLAGIKLKLAYLIPGGALALAVILARLAGKVFAVRLAMTLSGAPARIRNYLGIALTPQAGVAVALLLLIQNDPLFAEYHELFLAVGLAVVAGNEIIGPILLRFALGRSGDLGKDRDRLIDFIHEEHITTQLHAKTKEEAITKLVDHLMKTHVVKVSRDKLLESVLSRESEVSTCVGGGLAIPHGMLEEGEHMMGVMGICHEGLDFDAPDGHRVHCMVLLATPAGERKRHLEVLAALAKSIGLDPHIQSQLFHARSPAHAYEILHAEDSEDFNYFLDDGQD